MKRILLGSVLALTLAAGFHTAGSRLAAHDIQRQERPAAEDVRPSLERVVTGVVDPAGPGAAVLVVKDGKVLLKKGYGLADLDKRTPVTPETTFELASGSKPFTALAILRLEEAGKLDLSDDVRKYVPELPAYEEKRPIRLSDLLRHTSGLPDPFGGGTIREGSAADQVKWAADSKLHFGPGSRHEYSNMNYRLLALVVERVSGKTLGAYLHDEVFAPLGMTRTVVRETAKVVPAGRALGYSPGGLLDDGKKYRKGENDSIPIGFAGVWSCVDDMQKLDAALNSGKLLKAETLARAWTGGSLDDGTKFNYGLGWCVDKSKWGPKIWHSGGWPGFTTQHLRLPEQKLTVVVLRNWFDWPQGGNSAIDIADRLATVVLDGPPPAKDAPTEARLRALVGDYQADNGHGTVTATVVRSRDGLTLRLPGEAPYALVPAGPRRFALLGLADGFFVTYTLDGAKVKTLTLERPKGMGTVVFRPAGKPAHAAKDYDKEMADKVAGKVWLAEVPLTPDGKVVLRFAFRFTVRDGLLTGVLDDPDEGIVGIGLVQLRLDKDGVAFTWPGFGAKYEGTLSDDGKEIVGHWNQGGEKTPLRFRLVK
jgi:CubicO group peptidase (beta-lactamase class C family)